MPFQIHETLPFSHEQAVRMLAEAPWTPSEKRFMMEAGLVGLHGGFGKELRKNWHLWEPTTPLARHYQQKYRIGHADDMSSLIIQDLLCRMKGEEFDIEIHVKRMRDFWLSTKVDPATQREIQ